MSSSIKTQRQEVVRCGVVGAGDIAGMHCDALRSIPNAELVGLWNRPDCPIVPDVAKRAAELGAPKVYTSAEELVSDGSIDAVLILTNYETHLQYAKLAMDRGKHVLVEKPVAASVAEMEELQMHAERCGVRCMPVHNYIYEPHLWRTRDMIDSGKLGGVHNIYIMYNIHHPEEVCARLPGIVKQIGTHHCYIALYLLAGQMPEMVSAFKSTLRDAPQGLAPQENLATISMRTKNGTMIHLQMNFASDDHSSDAWSFYVKVIGSKGATRYSYNDWVVNKPEMVHSHVYEPYPHTILATDDHFINNVVLGGEEPLSTLKDAIMAQKMLDAADLSVEEQRHVCIQ